MSNRKLLLADDSATIRKVVDLTFADEGFDVIAVADGDAALESVRSTRPDVVLADVHMPGLTGYEVCERLKKSADTNHIPVVLLVGSFEPFDEAEAVRVGADANLTKPFQSIKMLVETVDRLAPRTVPVDAELDVATAELPDDLVPPADESGSVSLGPGQDTTDIDALLAESFSPPSALTVEEPQTTEYVDAGMDDRMIEEARGTVAAAPEASIDRNAGSDESRGEIYAAPETTQLDSSFVPARQSPFDTLAEHTPVNEAEMAGSFSGLGEIAGETTLEDIDLLGLGDSGDEIELTTPERASSSGSSARLVSVSPELMEMIVQKVVERLSERD